MFDSDFFRSPWFWIPAGAAALGLGICTRVPLRPVWRAAVGPRRGARRDELAHFPCRAELPVPALEVGLEAARAVLDAARWQIVEPPAGEGTLPWERNRLARLGTLLTHLAPLLRVVAVALSGLTGWRKHSGSSRGVSVA